MGDHGAHFDEFSAMPSQPHAPLSDGGYAPGPSGGSHGEHFDSGFAAGSRVSRHGERWDDFAWEALPPQHGGRLFDVDFAEPAALADGDGHGTWFDVFDGAAVRYLYDGLDYEGTVLNAGDGHLLVEPRHRKGNGGERHEVSLEQITEFARATRAGHPSREGIKTAHPGLTDGVSPTQRSRAEAPSARNATAHGGGRSPVDVDAVITPGVLNAKTADDELDVSKMAMADFHTHSCKGCGAAFHVQNGKAFHLTPRGDRHATLNVSRARTTCPGCSEPLNLGGGRKSNLVRKSIDSSDTAIQGDGEQAATITKRAHCPKSGNDRCGADVNGRCSVCGVSVHEAAAKTEPATLDVLKGLLA